MAGNKKPQTDSHQVDPKELEHAKTLWEQFMKVSTYVVVIIAITLGLMALFLT